MTSSTLFLLIPGLMLMMAAAAVLAADRLTAAIENSPDREFRAEDNFAYVL